MIRYISKKYIVWRDDYYSSSSPLVLSPYALSLLHGSFAQVLLPTLRVFKLLNIAGYSNVLLLFYKSCPGLYS